MPAVQTRLTAFSGDSSVWTSSSKVGSQRKLHDLKKVVSIKGGAINFDTVELLKGKQILDDPEASTTQLLETLRRLSCFDITQEMLLQSKVGHSVRCAVIHLNMLHMEGGKFSSLYVSTLGSREEIIPAYKGKNF